MKQEIKLKPMSERPEETKRQVLCIEKNDENSTVTTYRMNACFVSRFNTQIPLYGWIYFDEINFTVQGEVKHFRQMREENNISAENRGISDDEFDAMTGRRGSLETKGEA